MYRKSSIKPPKGLFISCPFGGGGHLIEVGSLFNVEKTMVSLLHKELEYKVEKLKYEKVGGHAARDQKSNPKFHLVNKPSWICPHKVLHLLVKTN